jgi:RimJ/RimL family protein N-acetyltransferase
MEERHAPDLFEVTQDEEVCRYLFWPPPTKLEETLTLVREATELMARRQSLVFAQVWNQTRRAIGSTRLLDVPGRPAGGDRLHVPGSAVLA